MRLEEEIGRRIAKRRAEQGLSGTKLAQMMGCEESQITGWERGEVCPRARSMMKLAIVLECEVGEFFPRTDWMP